jgi:uncharacterized protein
MTEKVSATPDVFERLERLAARYRPLVVHQSGGCCDGSSPICLPAGELPPGPGDVLLGTIGETPAYIDGEQDQHWQQPELRIGLSPGPAMASPQRASRERASWRSQASVPMAEAGCTGHAAGEAAHGPVRRVG